MTSGDLTLESFLEAEHLLRVQRRKVRLLILVADDDRRDHLTRAMVMDGFRHIRTAGSLVESLFAAKAGVDLLAFDSQVGAHAGLAVYGKLREAGLPRWTKPVLFSEAPSVREGIAARVLGVTLVPAPLDYPGPLKTLLDALLGQA
jgi:hypothetical protein